MSTLETEAGRIAGNQPDDATQAHAAGMIAGVLATVPGAEAHENTILGRFADLPDEHQTPGALQAIANDYRADPGQQAPRTPTVTGGAPAFNTRAASDSEVADELREAIANRDMAAYSRIKREHPELSVRKRLTGTTNYRQPQ